MAISPELWKKAKFLFELGKPLNFIAEETGITKGSISKKSKSEQWEKGKTKPLKDDILGFEQENSTLVEKKETLVEKVAQFDDFEITILNDVVENEAKTKSILFSNVNLGLIRSNQALTKNSKTVIVKTKSYNADGVPNGENIELVEVPLETSDIKGHIELNDKASITTNINQRHSQNLTQINNGVDKEVDKKIKVEWK